MKRIVLFLATNLAVMLVMSVVLSALGVDRYLSASGLNLGSLMVFSLVVGFTGAIFSLLISKPMAKWSTGARVIDAPSSSTELWLVDTVRRLSAARRHRHAGSRGVRGRGQCLCHRRIQEFGAGCGFHRPAGKHDQGRSRGGHRP